MAFLKSSDTSDLSDQELLDRYRETRQPTVVGVLYERYMDLVYGVCLRYLGDRELARDAVMHLFEELLEKLGRHQVDHFRAWLYQVARNHCLMQLRSAKGRRTVAIDPALVQSEDPVHLNGVWEKEQQLGRLERCLDTIPAEQRQTITQFYLQQKSYKEIAASTGQPWNQVRSYIQNGRRNLKACLEKQEPPNPIPPQTGERHTTHG